ncbi:thermonuclease family protein [Alphaproteobacteria bacterium]|nr:thermonuclease family protein [Alphaproteobacteria bacterium]
MRMFLIIILFPIFVFAKNYLRIVDGDTIHLNGDKIRFSGIDTPEIKQMCKKNEIIIPCGLIARDLLKKKIGSTKPVCIIEGKDQYGRSLGECFINEESLSSYLVRKGFAFAYTKYSKKFVQDEKFAIKNKLGMWDMDFIFPWDFRRSKYNYK